MYIFPYVYTNEVYKYMAITWMADYASNLLKPTTLAWLASHLLACVFNKTRNFYKL